MPLKEESFELFCLGNQSCCWQKWRGLCRWAINDDRWKGPPCFFCLFWLYLERLPPTWPLPLAWSRSWGSVCIFARSVLLSKRTRPPVSMCRSVLISPMTWEIFSWSVNNAVLVSTQPDQIILTIMPNKRQRKKGRTWGWWLTPGHWQLTCSFCRKTTCLCAAEISLM